MRIIFMGTGEIGLPSLRWLLEAEGCEVVGVYTQPDRPVGRKQKLTPPEVKVLAEEAGVPVYQPEKLRKPEAMAELRALQPDLIVVMAYGQILSKEVIDLPSIACLNLHASILPRHRGAAPIHGAIADGDSESGVTVMYVDVGLDTGDILLVERCSIHPEDTGGILHDRLAEVAPVAQSRAIGQLREGSADRIPQNEALVTYHPKLTRDDGRLDWAQPAEMLERRIRAFDPWPGTTTKLGGKTLKILPPTVVVASEPDAIPGTVITVESDSFVIACGEGSAVRIQEVQLEGRKRMPVRAFLAGNEELLRVGVQLG